MRKIGSVAIVVLMITAPGCAKQDYEPLASIKGEPAKAGSSLAYEHTIAITVPKGALRDRVAAVRTACSDETFGACSILELEEANGESPSGNVVVRIVPEGVEPLVALASEGGEVGSKATRAEDLAQVVADATRQREQLEFQRTKLLEFQGRKDLTVTDMLSIARELASVESQLADANRAGANQQRRIETNLLTMMFSTEVSSSSWSIVADAVTNSMGSFAEGTAEAIEAVMYGLPFILVGFPLALLIRVLWRRATSRNSPRAT